MIGSEHFRSTALWGTRIAAVAVCLTFALAPGKTTTGPAYFSKVLGAPVRVAPGESNQYLINAAPHSVDFTRLGRIHLDLGYTVGVTLPDGLQIGFRFEPLPEPPPTPSNAPATLALLAAGVAYVVCHFALFAAIFRHARAFRAERTIFLYHVTSMTVVISVAAAMVAWDVRLLAGAVGLVSIHAIYSLSFLELWSLAQGGYSLAILRELSGRGAPAAVSDDPMRSLGGRKVQARVDSLGRLWLLRSAGDEIALTRLGRATARVQAFLRMMVNVNPSD